MEVGHTVILDESVDDTQMPSFLAYFDPSNDESFWSELGDKKKRHPDVDYLLTEDVDDVRADRILRDLDQFEEDSLKDPVLIMMTSWYDEYELMCNNNVTIDQYTFESQVTKLAKIILKRKFQESADKKEICRYSDYFVYEKDTGIRQTLLHVAAEGNKYANKSNSSSGMLKLKRNFTDIAKCLISYDPGLVYATTEGESWGKLPLELALLYFDDEMASLLIRSMLEKCRVRMLFEHNYQRNESSKFRFIDYIERKDMKRTVIAVLDSLINPEWVFLPVRSVNSKDEREKWHKLPDIPIRYHFHFRILDGDRNGRKHYYRTSLTGRRLRDENYQLQQNSCLHALCLTDENAAAIRHPVVRLLARRKWNAYGRFYIRLYFFLFLVYFIFISFAILGKSPAKTSTLNNNVFKKIRILTEISGFIFSLIYGICEIEQLQRERLAYWKNVFNYLDVLGIISILVLFLVRWFDSGQHWLLASIAYMSNCLRIFKYFSAFRGTGVYVRTLASLVRQNVPVFLSVYGVLVLCLSGGSLLALRASSGKEESTGTRYSGTRFSDIVLRSIRVVAEGQAFTENGSSYSTFALVIILGNMMIISLLLVNILIAQLTESYSRAQADAITQYDISKSVFTTRIENNWIPFLRYRQKYYEEGCFMNETDLVEELYSEKGNIHHQDRSVEDIADFRNSMRKIGIINDIE